VEVTARKLAEPHRLNVRRRDVKTPNPKRSWFLLPLPIAMIIAEAILLIRALALQDQQFFAHFWKSIGPLLGITSIAGMIFPAGLVAPFVMGTPEPSATTLIFAGWALYAGLTVLGLVKPSRALFLILCFLLVINIVGCQFVVTERLKELH
jgi:hypothetical protein